MSKFKRISTRGWIGNAISILTFGYYPKDGSVGPGAYWCIDDEKENLWQISDKREHDFSIVDGVLVLWSISQGKQYDWTINHRVFYEWGTRTELGEC